MKPRRKEPRPHIVTRPRLPEYGIPYSNPHLHRLEKAGLFPKRIRLSPKTVGWLESEIIEWILDRAAARKGGVDVEN